jgi:hypothetical protein
MRLTSRYFATAPAPGHCAVCGDWYLDLGGWLAVVQPRSREPAFEPDFLYALSDGRWVCSDCAMEVDPAFCHEQARRDTDNHLACLDAWEAAGSHPWHQCCRDCCPPWRKSGGCPLRRSPREEILWRVHNCTCATRPAYVEELRKHL